MSLRIIGIRHRRKKTAEGEARPTTVAIKESGDFVCHNLETETDELDFLMARFPTDWEPVGDTDVEWFDAEKSPNGLRPHHCKWRKAKEEEISTVRQNHIRQIINQKGMPVTERLTKIPIKFDGLKSGDKVAMVLGGSGDRFAAALSRRGEEIGAETFRLPPFSLHKERGQKSKDDDHLTLAELLEKKPKLFYKLGPKDRDTIRVKEALALRQDAQKARIGCEQRLYQSLVGKIFLSEQGKYPEGLIEDQYDKLKASDTILQGLIAEEELRNKELEKVVVGLQIWKEVFETIEGFGKRIAAALISAIGDIRRFAVPVNYNGANTSEERKNRLFKAINQTLAKVKHQCGAHISADGTFPRRQTGQVANWSPMARQGLYLLCDQFNRRPGSEWGGKLLAQKAKYRQTHPEPVKKEVEIRKNGKKVIKTVTLYTDGHIHKMGLKWCATKFVEWMARQWLKLEKVYEN